MDRQQDVIRRITAHIVAYRFHLENERHRNMSRLTEKLALAAAVAPRQAAKIEARADRILAREPGIEQRTDDVFVPHERLMDEAEQGLDGLDAALRRMSNNPPLEHSTPLPGGPRVLPDSPAGVGDLNLPGPVGTRVALGPHPDQPEVAVADKIVTPTLSEYFADKTPASPEVADGASQTFPARAAE